MSNLVTLENNQLDKDLIKEHNELIKSKSKSPRIYEIRMAIFKKYKCTWDDETGLIYLDLDYNPIKESSNKKEQVKKQISEISMNAKNILLQCTVVQNRVYLPDEQIDRKLYMEVAKALELIGGKWTGGKIKAFVFAEDPTDLLAEIASGEKRNLKKEHQFFGTPPELADRLIELAQLNNFDRVLEPSAGQGAIVEAMQRKWHNIVPTCVENMGLNSIVLTKKQITHFFQDFLTSECSKPFDKVIANPPFTKNQDIDHIYKMVEVCKPGGIVVSCASNHWRESKNKKETEFRAFLDGMGAVIEEIPAGTFKESGTMIAACIVIIHV
jgi:hypothetical protein